MSTKSFFRKQERSFLYYFLAGTLTFFVFVLAFESCKSDMIRDYYLVQTGQVTRIDTSGVWFTARIVNKTSDPITDHGFVWGCRVSNPTIGTDQWISLGPAPSNSSFESFIDEEYLERDTTNFIRAYVKTAGYTSYGPSSQLIYSFSKIEGQPSIPEITDIQPNPMVWKDTIIITGKNFSTDRSRLSVMIKLGNENFPLTIFKSNIHQIKTMLPVFVSVNNPAIKVINKTAESAYKSFAMMPPIIDSIVPRSGKPPLTVRLYGRNLGFGYVNASVYFNQTLASPQISTQGVQVVSLPSGLPVGTVNVTASFIGLSTVKQNFFTILP